MLINFNKLKHLPVFTKNGVKLGKLSSVVINVDNHHVNSYLVKPSILSESFLIVKPVQVISVNEETMIVDETVTKSVNKVFVEQDRPKNEVLAGAMILED